MSFELVALVRNFVVPNVVQNLGHSQRTLDGEQWGGVVANVCTDRLHHQRECIAGGEVLGGVA